MHFILRSQASRIALYISIFTFVAPLITSGVLVDESLIDTMPDLERKFNPEVEKDFAAHFSSMDKFAEEEKLDALLRIGQREASLTASIDAVGRQLLGTPYLAGASGEGPTSNYDRDPLWRLDVFDCTTYLETVAAISLSNDRNSFWENLKKIRYKNSEVTYLARNHFVEIDWIPNNTKSGMIRDITKLLFPDQYRVANIEIDKPLWLQKKDESSIEPTNRPLEERRTLAKELNASAALFSKKAASIPYLPMNLFYQSNPDPSAQIPNKEILGKIPNGSIFNIIRENWRPGGLAMAVSHQGFIIQRDDGTYMRHASTNRGVVEEKLDVYFRRFQGSETVRGINILEFQK